jgi:type I restriction enzyme S subunit
MDTKKLRQKVLDLAIHGKLVKQDPNDEPASILLDRIRAEKARLVKEGKIKKSDLIEKPISEDEIPFEVPEGWEWVKIQNIAFCTKLAGFEYTKYIADNLVSKENGIPLFKGKNIQNGRIIYEFESYIPIDISYELTRSQINKKCLLTPYVGTIGNIGIHNKEGIFHLGSNVGKIEFYNYFSINILEEYSQYFLLSKNGYEELAKHKKMTAQESISIEAIRDVNIPIPPLAEQHRIVKAVDELFEQIDIIERSEKELEEAANKTRDKLLNLAIQGHLVPQDPNEEPASVLLERIRAEKARLVKEGKLKKKDLEEKPISPDEIPFDIPEGWVWCRVSEIALDSADGPFGSNLKKEHYTDKREVRIIQLSNIGESGWKDANVKYTTFDYLPNIARSEAFAGDIIIAKMMPAGRAIICPDHEKKYVLSSDAVRFDFSSNLDKKFLYYAINSSVFKNQVYSEVQGVTRVRTSLNKLRCYLLPIPPLSEQRRIVTKLEELLKEIDKLKV